MTLTFEFGLDVQDQVEPPNM